MSQSLTYLDIVKRQDSTGKVPAPVELLSQTNAIVNDIPFRETNQQMSELVVARVGLPDVYYRIMNSGVQLSSSETAQWEVDCAKMEVWAEVDTEVLARAGQPEAIKADEASSMVMAMEQAFSYRLFYGNSSVDTEEFTGFSPQYSLSSAANGQNIILAGGDSNDNMSVWCIYWGDTVGGIVPQGMPTGWKQSPWEKITRQQVNTAGSETRYTVESTHFEWYHGLVVRDWRDVKCIRNIPRSGLYAGTTDLRKYMNDLMDIPTSGAGSPVIYMRRDCLSFLREQCESKVGNGGGLTFENIDGRPVTKWQGIPIRIVDQLLDTEGTFS